MAIFLHLTRALLIHYTRRSGLFFPGIPGHLFERVEGTMVEDISRVLCKSAILTVLAVRPTLPFSLILPDNFRPLFRPRGSSELFRFLFLRLSSPCNIRLLPALLIFL